MLSFDENGWLYPDSLNNITHYIDSAKIKDLLKLAEKEDYWSAGVREAVKKRLKKEKDNVRLDCRGYNDKKYRRNCYFNAFW